jgi:16S rRNA processing protein RimM
VQRGRSYQRAWLLHFEGIEDRTALEQMRERYLGITVGEARPLDDGEFFLHELVGLRVELKDRTVVGTVREIYDAPQAYLLAVTRATGEGPEHLVPFRAGIVRRVERGERVVIEPPDGLLEL